jgi:hypothetical protein
VFRFFPKRSVTIFTVDLERRHIGSPASSFSVGIQFPVFKKASTGLRDRDNDLYAAIGRIF